MRESSADPILALPSAVERWLAAESDRIRHYAAGNAGEAARAARREQAARRRMTVLVKRATQATLNIDRARARELHAQADAGSRMATATWSQPKRTA